MRLPPIAYGFDSVGPPNLTSGHGLAGVRAMLRWVLDHTNLRFAGGYNSIAVWRPLLEPLWADGYGLSIFDNSAKQPMKWRESSIDGGRTWTIATSRPANPTTAEGEADGRTVRDNANRAATQLGRRVVYVDNEDNAPHVSKAGDLSGANLTSFQQAHNLAAKAQVRIEQTGFDDFIEYYRGLFYWLERQPPDQVPIRAGLYVKLWVASSLLSEFPYLYLCDVGYPCHKPLPQCWDVVSATNPFNTSDPYSMQRLPAGDIQLQPSEYNALPTRKDDTVGRPIPATTRGRGPARPWLAWPVIYQFEGTNKAPLAATPQTVALVGGPPTVMFTQNTWAVDYESALVDDPAFPTVSPRLSMSSGTTCFLSRVDRVDPPVNDTRQGRRVVTRFQSNGADSFVALPLAEHAGALGKIAPGVRARWLRVRNEVVCVTPRLTRFDLALETHRLQGGTLVAAQPSIATPPDGRRLFVHTPWDAVARTPDDAHLFAVADNGSLLTSHAAPADVWPPLVVQADRAVHHYSELAAASRGEWSVDAFFIGADRALHTTWWNPSLVWPSRTNMAIGIPEVLLPTTHLVAVSPDPNTILVFGVGFDLRLHIASWTSPGPWAGPTPLGGPDDMLSAHSDVAAVWNPARQICEVVAVGNDVTLWLYQIGSTGRAWSATAPRLSLFTPASDPNTRMTTAAPNPFGDVAIGYAGARRVVAAVLTAAGASRAQFKSSPAMSDPATGPWTDWQA